MEAKFDTQNSLKATSSMDHLKFLASMDIMTYIHAVADKPATRFVHTSCRSCAVMVRQSVDDVVPRTIIASSLPTHWPRGMRVQ